MVPPKVSVVFSTYNHARYVERALRSVLAQVTDFAVEVVIGDDCSTDGTAPIIDGILAEGTRHSVKYLRHARNLGAMGNFLAIYGACSGEYIAVLEGDDYWSDSQKLQQQAGLLDAKPEASLCFHNCEVFNDSAGAFVGVSPEPKYRRADLTAEDMLNYHMIPSNTKMWRWSVLPDFGDCASARHLDLAIDVLLALRGKVIFIDQVMSVYRLHGGGMWTGAGKLDRDIASYLCLDYLHRSVPREFRSKVMHRMVGAQAEIIVGQRLKGDSRLPVTALSFLRNVMRQEKGNRVRMLRWLVGVLFRKAQGPGPANA